ncbi:MAG: DUF1501 domain-containing protein [Gemmataceae bacterium]
MRTNPQSNAGSCREFHLLPTCSRREFLRVGGLSALGLSLPALLAAEAQASNAVGARAAARAQSCILLFLSGGPSQFETFDPKPEAKIEVRNIFGTISTKVPGMHICEHLADLAPLADRFALIRSAWHRQGGHFGGQRFALSGHVAPGNPDAPARADDQPGIIGLAAKYMATPNSLPPAFMAPWLATDQGSGASGGMGGGVLGKQFDPLLVEVDPKSLTTPEPMPLFRVPEIALQPNITPERFERRQQLLQVIESQRRAMADLANARQMNNFYHRAYELLSSPKIKEGFELEQEPHGRRVRYGANAFGQSCLLARRLIERGARFVQVNFARTVTQNGYGWDTHDKGRETLKEHLLPKLNAGLSSLLVDLSERGLLDDTLVVAMGEFGRTPRVKPDGGRDHWPQCYSLLLAGGGIRGGGIHGRSDKDGAYPADNPVEARDILMTMLTLLGIPTAVTDSLGRVVPLFPESRPIERLYA